LLRSGVVRSGVLVLSPEEESADSREESTAVSPLRILVITDATRAFDGGPVQNLMRSGHVVVDTGEYRTDLEEKELKTSREEPLT
jgi:hypothetical protein